MHWRVKVSYKTFWVWARFCLNRTLMTMPVLKWSKELETVRVGHLLWALTGLFLLTKTLELFFEKAEYMFWYLTVNIWRRRTYITNHDLYSFKIFITKVELIIPVWSIRNEIRCERAFCIGWILTFLKSSLWHRTVFSTFACAKS